MTDRHPAILLVDDDVDICHNMSDILSELGYHVDVANEGESALELVRRRPYDVALLDLKMPGMDGLTLYREIKKLRADTVALLVTAYAGGTVSEDAVTAGVWHILPKPVDLPRLMGLIDSALEQPVVLVVDDDDDLCANLWDLLRSGGYRVCIAHDGEQAASRLREATRVVLIDLKLPGHDGSEVFRQVREANPDVRTVLITGHETDAEGTIERLLAEGIDAVCYKPFDIPKLLGIVAHLTEV